MRGRGRAWGWQWWAGAYLVLAVAVCLGYLRLQPTAERAPNEVRVQPRNLREAYDYIQEGMPIRQVQSILGPPMYVRDYGPPSMWYHDLGWLEEPTRLPADAASAAGLMASPLGPSVLLGTPLVLDATTRQTNYLWIRVRSPGTSFEEVEEKYFGPDADGPTPW